MGVDAVIDIQQASKIYKSFGRRLVALDNISCQINRGRVVALLGPNGAGKTTLVKLLLGLTRLSSGNIQIFNKEKIDLNDKMRIGFMPEDDHLYDFLSVRESLEFTRKLYRNKELEYESIDRVLEIVGLSEHQSKKINQCSKGMRRRLVLAQTLIHDPDLYLFDEPTNGFDPFGISDMKQIVMSLKSKGKTILLCSHQLAEIEELIDDLIILYDGKIVVQAEYEKIKSEMPQSAIKIENKDMDMVVSVLREKGVSYSGISAGVLENYFVRKVSEWLGKS